MAPTTEMPAGPSAMKFTIDGKTYSMVDPQDLEFREIEAIEDAFDLPIEEIDWRRQKFARWLMFASIRRQDPDATITYEDLGEIKYSELKWSEAKAAKKPAAKRRPTKARKGA